jgi:AraC-like DNA-binding protein
LDLLHPTFYALRLRAAVAGSARLGAPWALRVPAGDRPVFHALTGGECRLTPQGGDPVDLVAGDLVIVADGREHALRDSGTARDEELWWLQPWQRGWAGLLSHGGAGGESRLVSGAFSLTGSPAEPLLRQLPPLIHLRGCPRPGAWLEASLSQLEPRVADDAHCATTIVDRLVEIAMLDALRAWVDRTGSAGPLRDARIARALARIHGDDDGDCTLAGLAEAAGMCRASFCERFRELIGEPPGRYAQRSRMRRAADWIVEGLAPQDAASRLGYSSVDAFSRAFKRVLGLSPGAWLRSAGDGPARCSGSAPPDERR